MFKSRLKELRASRKWTQSDLAKKLNVLSKQSAVGSCRAEPNSDALAKIAALFGTSVDYLLGIDDKKLPNKPSNKIDTIAAHIDDDVCRKNR